MIPSEPGWYWYTPAEYKEPVPAWVSGGVRFSLRAWVFGTTHDEKVSEMLGSWGPRLAPPDGPDYSLLKDAADKAY